MKKRFMVVFLIVLIAFTVFSVQRDKIELTDKTVDKYYISGYYDQTEKVLKGYQQVIYYNKEENILDSIYFYLYPNAFQQIEKVPFLHEEMMDAYPLGFDPGFIEIHEVRVEGGYYKWEYTGNDHSILRIKLDKPLKPGEHVVVDMKYTLKFPLCYGRFGYGEKTVKAANWYPIAAVFDNSGWNLERYFSIGDPFYSDVSDYLVDIVLDSDYVIASTGEIENVEKISGNCRKWTIRGDAVRDFAWIASKEYKVAVKKYSGVEVRSYYLSDEGGKEALEAAGKSIELFSTLFGDYPYNVYSVASADFFLGGMEYPNLVFINEELYNKKDLFSLKYVVVHETAHQWWYGIVGNNEVTEAWLDEGLTEYSTILYFYNIYDTHTAEVIFNNMIEKPYNDFVCARKNSGCRILHSLGEYQNWNQYASLVYSGGACVIHWLRQLTGDKKFFEGLKAYYDTYKFKNATTDDFIKIMQKKSGIQFEEDIKRRLLQSH